MAASEAVIVKVKKPVYSSRTEKIRVGEEESRVQR